MCVTRCNVMPRSVLSTTAGSVSRPHSRTARVEMASMNVPSLRLVPESAGSLFARQLG